MLNFLLATLIYGGVEVMFIIFSAIAEKMIFKTNTIWNDGKMTFKKNNRYLLIASLIERYSHDGYSAGFFGSAKHWFKATIKPTIMALAVCYHRSTIAVNIAAAIIAYMAVPADHGWINVVLFLWTTWVITHNLIVLWVKEKCDLSDINC